MPLPSRLSDITHVHLEQILGESEGQHLDFKRELPTNWDQEAKKRFMADVVAFANGGGGDLVYGVEEGPGAVAGSLVPQVFDNVDVQIRRVQEFLLDLAEPRLPGVQVVAVPLSVGSVHGHAIIIRVPQSWSAPHRSKANLHFYVRDGVRNRQLDIPEVRALFLRSDNQAERMRNFRAARLAKIVTGQMPVPIGEGPKLIVHAVPTQAALGQAFIDPLPYFRGERRLPVLGLNSVSRVQLNLDGAFGPILAGGQRPPGYTQHFRDGHFEAVVELRTLSDTRHPAFVGVAHERYIVKYLSSVREEVTAFGVSNEVAVFLSLVGANQAVYAQPSHVGHGREEQPFDRSDLLLPDVLLAVDVSVEQGVRPMFDLLAQAAGYEKSPSYGRDGEWLMGN